MSSWGGDLIKITRLEAKLSQRERARRAGTSQAALSAYESGKKSPTLETVHRIVLATGQDLRIQVVPYDDHDEWVARYEASVDPRDLERWREFLRRPADA